jgi:hypothetical protein
MSIDLIKCGNHSFSPWSIVCIHLMNGESKEWIPVESTNLEVDFDWLCPKCIDNYFTPVQELDDSETPDLTDLRPVCMHCVRHLRQKLDENFKKEQEDDQ